MGKNKAQAPTLPRIRYNAMSCFSAIYSHVAVRTYLAYCSRLIPADRKEAEGICSTNVEALVSHSLKEVRFLGGWALLVP